MLPGLLVAPWLTSKWLPGLIETPDYTLQAQNAWVIASYQTAAVVPLNIKFQDPPTWRKAWVQGYAWIAHQTFKVNNPFLCFFVYLLCLFLQCSSSHTWYKL